MVTKCVMLYMLYIYGQAIVCAHRYVQIFNGAYASDHGHVQFINGSYQGTGLCYLLPNNLNGTSALALKLCSSTDCQLGLSAAFLDDKTVLMGVPNHSKRGGSVFSYNNEAKPKLKHTIDKVNIGMSVVCAHFHTKDKKSFAVGAPRSETVYVYSDITDKKPATLTLPNGLGSNFGYEIISADVNGDSWADLLVGAPMYFSDDDKEQNGGAVFVYHNNLPRLDTPFLHFKTKLFVKSETESAFGLSMANLGDINHDTCEDIAIGAPYEGSGVVYIYLGHRLGLKNQPSQIIRPSDFPKFISTAFGYSLSGGVDFDQNSYPDLLIGSINSDSVMAVMTRPMFNFSIVVDSPNDIDQWDSCAANTSWKDICFQVNVSSGLMKYPQYLVDTVYTFGYKIVAMNSPHDMFNVDIDNNSDSKILLSTNGTLTNTTHIVYISKKPTSDLLHSIDVSCI